MVWGEWTAVNYERGGEQARQERDERERGRRVAQETQVEVDAAPWRRRQEAAQEAQPQRDGEQLLRQHTQHH